MSEAEAFAAYQLNLYSEGMNCTAILAEIERGYDASFQAAGPDKLPLRGWVQFVSGDWHDAACVEVTGDPDNPLRCIQLGRGTRLPNVAFELAAQIHLCMVSALDAAEEEANDVD